MKPPPPPEPGQDQMITASSWRELDQRMTELEQQGWIRPRGTSSVAEYGRVTYFATMRRLPKDLP
jgi:hypothetical protein